MPGKTRNVAVFNDTQRSRHFGCKLVMREMLALMTARGLRQVWSQRVGRNWKPRADAIRALPDLAAIIVNGEGTIHHTATKPKPRRLLELASFAHQELRVPAYLVNATLYEIANEDAARLGEFDAVFVRDHASRLEAQRLGVEARVVPDLTLHAELPSWAGERSGICGTDSVREAIAAQIHQLCRIRGWSYWPIAYPLRNLKRQPPSVDKFLPSFIAAYSGVQDYAAVLARFMSRHRLVVTGRYHAVAYAMLTRTPFVAVESNTPKISAMLTDALGSTRRVISAEELPHMDFERFANWDEDELRRLEAFCTYAHRAAEGVFDEILAGMAAWPRDPGA